MHTTTESRAMAYTPAVTTVIQAGRTASGLLAQKVDQENEARLALAEAEQSGDAERIRLATEVLGFCEGMHDAALLDLVDTVQHATEHATDGGVQ